MSLTIGPGVTINPGISLSVPLTSLVPPPPMQLQQWSMGTINKNG
jgi:hypothetical protein